MNKKEKIIVFVALASFLVVWSLIIYNFSPTEITESLGTTNSYILQFFASFLGGSSIFVPFPYYLLVITLGAAGFNPILLGLVSGFGVILGDSISYLVGYLGKGISSKKINTKLTKIHNWLTKQNYFIVATILFLYGAITPLPNDLVIIPLGLTRFGYWKVMIPIGIGNIFFNIWLALIGFYGLSIFF